MTNLEDVVDSSLPESEVSGVFILVVECTTTSSIIIQASNIDVMVFESINGSGRIQVDSGRGPGR